MVVLSFHLTWCHWIWFFCYERVPHSCALVSGVLSSCKPISSVIFQKLDMIPALFHLLLKDLTSIKCHPTARRWNCFHHEWDNFFFHLHSPLNVNYSVLMTFFLNAGLRERDKDLAPDSWLHKRLRYWHSTAFICCTQKVSNFSCTPVGILMVCFA